MKLNQRVKEIDSIICLNELSWFHSMDFIIDVNTHLPSESHWLQSLSS